MRKLLLSILLAGTAASLTTPAIAQRGDRVDRDDSAEAREERRAQREQARRERSEAAREEPRPHQVERVERAERRAIAEERNFAGDRPARVERPAVNVNERGRPTLEQRERVRERLVERGQQDPGELRERRTAEDLFRRRPRVTPPRDARPDRPAPPPETASHRRSHPEWRRAEWRRDHRYDWRRWRDRHRSIFRLGFYYDPFGWSYRRYGVGWRLWPSYYSRDYWLNDPWSYRLPYAPWPYKWVRYYDDALLVNTISGQVVDVEYNFFW